jgi:ArsR family transcriptional regulator
MTHSTGYCCSPGDSSETNGGIPESDLSVEELALICKALGHPARLRVLRYLISHGECFFGDLSSILPLSASTVSQHLTVLKESGLVVGSADEQRTCYCVNTARLALFKRLIAEL